MVEYYNMTNLTSSGSLLDLARNSDRMLGGNFFGFGVIIMVAVVCYVTLIAKGNRPAVAITATLWLNMIVCWILKAMMLIDNYTLWGSVILMIGATFVLFLSNN